MIGIPVPTPVKEKKISGLGYLIINETTLIATSIKNPGTICTRNTRGRCTSLIEAPRLKHSTKWNPRGSII
jgi:hypothetical protein